MIHTAEYDSPIGPITLASDGTHLVGLWLRGQKYYGDGVPGEWTAEENLPVLAAGKEWLRRYLPERSRVPGSCPWRRPAVNSGRQCTSCCVKSPMGKRSAMANWQSRQPLGWAWPVCPPKLWAALWDITPFPSSFPATGLWGPPAA